LTPVSKVKRVILFSHNSNLSGAPISISQLARKLPDYGFSPLLVLPKSGPLETLLQSWHLEYRILTHANAIGDFVRIVKRENPVLIHVNSLVKTWKQVLVSRMMGVPVIWHVREHLKNNRLNARIVHALADQVVLLSRDQLDLFRGMRKLTIIPNGVDIALFRNVKPSQILSGITGRKTVITYVGAIEKRKGSLVLAQAAVLMKDRPWLHYIVVGDAPKGSESYKEEVIELLKREGIHANFHFLGYRSDVPEILAESDILCHPAFIEVFPRVILEAMASSLPVISTFAGAIPEMVEDKKTALLVEAGDPRTLSEAIGTMDLNVHLRKRMGEAGFNRVKERFSLEFHTKKVSELYARLIRD
jgi:glycosyltransferase involved in cell wall biosynthesis